MPFHDRSAILLLSGTLALTNVACSHINSSWRPTERQEPVAVSVTPSPVIQLPTKPKSVNPKPVNPKPVVIVQKLPTLPAKDAYEQALDAAYSAAILGQSAQSTDDWQLVTSRWQEAIALLRKVPFSSAYHAIAQPKIAQYQRNLRVAQKQATRPRPSSPSTREVAASPRIAVSPAKPSPTQTSSPLEAPNTPETPNIPAPTTESQTIAASPRVYKAPIKRRAGLTPVIEVTFNGAQTFEMIIDTGASGTVITKSMAESLGVVAEGEVVANTASAKGIKFSIGKVESIAVAGIVTKDVRVAIGGSELDLGLLGQDFFGNYDVWIRQNIVEFHPR